MTKPKATPTPTLAELGEFKGLTICARRFALAWRAVARAASNDEDRETLYRTVLVEQHPNGVMLVATDSRLLLWAWVGVDEVEQREGRPDLDFAPSAELVIRTTSPVAEALFGHVVKMTTDKGTPDYRAELRLELGAVEPDPDRPTLGSELDQPALLVTFWADAVALPIMDGAAYPPWRNVIHQPGDKAPGRLVGLDGDYLKTVAATRVDDRRALQVELLGPAKGVAITIPGDPLIHGRLMPTVGDA